MSRRFAAAVLVAGLPIAAPACIVRDEFDESPFNIDPPTELWYEMHDVVTPADEFHPERDWVARCLDWGGEPTISVDGKRWCEDADY